MKRRRRKPAVYCGRCLRPVRRGHKWWIDGCTVKHDDCENPTLRVLPQPLFRKDE